MSKKINVSKLNFSGFTDIVPIEKGGTSSNNVNEIAVNLNSIMLNEKNIPNGVAGLGSDGKLNKDLFTIVEDSVIIEGDIDTNVNGTTTFTIANYSSFNTYTISVTAGTVSRIGDTITYNAPNIAQTVTMTINGVDFILNIVPVSAYVNTPSVTSPINSVVEQNSNVSFTSSAFSSTGTTDTHEGSDWELSRNSSFSDIVGSVVNSATHKTTWIATGLIAGNTYYVRVKHKGATVGYSNWSNVISFTVTQEIVTISGTTDVTVSTTGTFTITNYNSANSYTVSVNAGTVSRSGATITFTAPSSAQTVTMTINSRTFTLTVIPVAAIISTPIITSPANGSSGTSTSVNFTSNAFSMVSGNDIHEGTDWQLSTDGGFINLMTYVVNSSSNKTSWTTTGLVAGTTYYARVKYKGVAAGYSSWSNVISFSVTQETITIDTPSITSPANGSSGTSTSVNFTSDAFSLSSGTDTHEGSDWQISTSSSFTTTTASVTNSTTNKTSWTATGLVAGQGYFARVRYKGVNGGYSSWSNTIFLNVTHEIVTISGTTTVTVNTTGTYTITNYNASTTYTITVTAGSTTRSGSTITFTAPSTAQTVTMNINGTTFTLNVVPIAAYVNTPSITSPTNGSSGTSTSVNFTSNAFSMGSGTDTHEGSDWQISTSSSFTTILNSVTNSTSNKTSWTATGLVAGTTYYARVRYKGVAAGYSNWSTIISFNVIQETPTISGTTTVTAGTDGTFTITNYNAAYTYSISVTAGTVSRSGATITFTAPSTAQTVTMTINGTTFSLTVIAVVININTPSITSPANGSSGTSTSVNFTSNAFSLSSGTDTHESSDWQVSTSSSFTTITISVTNSTSNKTSWTATGLVAGNTYYARVKYKGVSGGYSSWSNVISFTVNQEAPTISGNTTVTVSNTATFTITNYNAAYTYNITVTAGSTTRSGSTITFSAPSTAQTVTMTINGTTFSLSVIAVVVTIATPSITSPTNGAAGQNTSMNFTSNTFSLSTGTGVTHESSDWQLSTDGSFTNITNSSVNSTTNKTTWSVTGLLGGTAYYVRVRYKGTNGNYSAWSNGISFIVAEAVTISGSTTITVSTTNQFTITNYNASNTYIISVSAGTISRVGSTLTVVAPSTVQTVTMTINSSTFSLSVIAVVVNIASPTITSPTNGSSGHGTSVSFTSSAFTLSSGTGVTHQSTDWQLATDLNYTNIVRSATDDTINKTTWSVTGLTGGTTYYTRIRYKGSNGNYCAWSSNNIFYTATTFSGTEQAKLIGTATNIGYGLGVNINDAGDTVVVGAYSAPNSTMTMNYMGYVKVYKLISGTWTQQGATLTGESSYEQFGVSVSLNSTGDILAVGGWGNSTVKGYVKVYKLISGTWTLQGAKIEGDNFLDYFGTTSCINGAGDTVIIGAWGANSNIGYVKVYKLISGTWTLQGIKITGEAVNDYFGMAVDINDAGDIVVIGASGTTSSTGYVKVYKLISGTWTLQATKLTGEANGDEFGQSVSINGLGDIIAVGAWKATVYGVVIKGYVKVYYNVFNSWNLQGAKLVGDAANDGFGTAVSLNNTGDILAVGAGNANSSKGYTKVYKLIASTWTQQGITLQGEAASDKFGDLLSFNSAGDILIVSAYGANTQTGYVKVYK